MNPTTRMLELLSLLQDGRTRPASDLAARLKTSPRTIRRDLDRLRELGYPVVSRRGPGGSYQLVAGRALPPLLLSDDEAVATVVGLRIATLTEIDGPDGAAARALRKLEQVLPTRLRHRVRALAESTDVVSRGGNALDLTTVQTLALATQNREDIRFDYRNRNGHSRKRRVEPYRQILLGRHWYLLGFDRDSADWRTYRVDRIREISVPGTTFVSRPLPSQDPVSFVQDSRRFPATPRQGVVRFFAPVDVVAEQLRAEAGTLEAIDETSCRYVSAADSWEWLSVTLAAVGLPYAIEGPPELVAHSRECAERILRAIGSGP